MERVIFLKHRFDQKLPARDAASVPARRRQNGSTWPNTGVFTAPGELSLPTTQPPPSSRRQFLFALGQVKFSTSTSGPHAFMPLSGASLSPTVCLEKNPTYFSRPAPQLISHFLWSSSYTLNASQESKMLNGRHSRNSQLIVSNLPRSLDIVCLLAAAVL